MLFPYHFMLARKCAVGSVGPWVAQGLLTNEADPGDAAVIDPSRLSGKGKL